MLYTSGTTGWPRASPWALRRAAGEGVVDDEVDLWAPRPGDVHLVCAPTSHSARCAQRSRRCSPGHAGGHGALRRSARAGGAARAAPTTTFMVPDHMERLLTAPGLGTDERFDSLRLCSTPAPRARPLKRRCSPVSHPGAHRILRIDRGQFTACSDAECWPARARSGGLAGSHVCTSDRAAPRCGGEAIGVIWCRAPAFARFSTAPADATAAAGCDAFMSDLGWLDDEGYLYIAGVGRTSSSPAASTLPRRGGNGHRRLPRGRRRRVYGTPDEHWAKRVCAGNRGGAPIDATPCVRLAGRLAPAKRRRSTAGGSLPAPERKLCAVRSARRGLPLRSRSRKRVGSTHGHSQPPTHHRPVERPSLRHTPEEVDRLLERPHHLCTYVHELRGACPGMTTAASCSRRAARSASVLTTEMGKTFAAARARWATWPSPAASTRARESMLADEVIAPRRPQCDQYQPSPGAGGHAVETSAWQVVRFPPGLMAGNVGCQSHASTCAVCLCSKTSSGAPVPDGAFTPCSSLGSVAKIIADRPDRAVDPDRSERPPAVAPGGRRAQEVGARAGARIRPGAVVGPTSGCRADGRQARCITMGSRASRPSASSWSRARDEFVERFSSHGRPRGGDPFDPATDVGPLSRTPSARRSPQVDDPKARRGGGHRRDDPRRAGIFYPADVLSGITPPCGRTRKSSSFGVVRAVADIR